MAEPETLRVHIPLTLRNRGDVVTGVPAFNLVDSASQFAMTPSDACKAPLEPGSSCLVTVEFAPTTSGKKDASLIATASPGGQTSSDLTGEGVDPLSISPTDKDFGDVKINSEGPTDLITVRNSGAVPTGPLQINLNGGGSKEFEIVSNTCEEQGKGIALKANAECFITVGFTPTKIGAKVATLTVSGSPGGNVSTSIRGNAVAAGLVISPLEHDFGNATVDNNSNNGPTFSFTVRNDSQAQTARLTTMINPESPDDFTITNDGCEGRQLPVNGSCNITVRFDPTGVDARSASLEVSAGANSTTLVALRGNGTYNDELLIEPTRYDFGTVSANQFIDQTFDIVNRGQSQLRDLNVELLTGSASFNVISDGCSDVLAAGSRCSVTVRFGSPTPGQTVRTRTLEATCSNAGVPDVTSELRGFVQQ